ncbi:MAG: DegT/DnrJ/EryC1/StrS family aminotransferase [Candidatus Hadarchaeum sp.]|uniref:DegT/DnrJ/EryC1/StrS family aminotransferase n=1 Tax=Candidatus Hadarchaeum sp. TaxID=2883567 RepID=UPI003D0E6D7E
MTWKIPLFRIYWDKEDVKSVRQSLEKGMYWAAGPQVEEFEKAISEYIRRKYSLVFNSGTSALHAALLAHGIKRGDEVIVPSFTFIATANAPLFVGARPVFADIEEKTYGLDPEDVKEKINRKTKAIIPVHYGGCPCKIQELKEIAEDRGLFLIEDAAEAFGASVSGKKVGSFGDSAMFSFCQNKVITTGEGGAIVTDSRKIYEKLKLIRSHGRAEDGEYFTSPKRMDYVDLGYNFRMSNIAAALGVAQLKKVNRIIELRRKNAEYLTKKLAKINEVVTPSPPEGYFHVYQMYTIRVKSGNRDDLSCHLTKKGIMTKVFFHPVHLTYFYRKKLGYKTKLPVTEEVSKQVLTLPMYPNLSGEELDYIIEAVESFFEVC